MQRHVTRLRLATQNRPHQALRPSPGGFAATPVHLGHYCPINETHDMFMTYAYWDFSSCKSSGARGIVAHGMCIPGRRDFETRLYFMRYYSKMNCALAALSCANGSTRIRQIDKMRAIATAIPGRKLSIQLMHNDRMNGMQTRARLAESASSRVRFRHSALDRGIRPRGA